MTVARCIAEGLVGDEGFAVDASLIRADVQRQRSVPGEQGLPPEAVGRAVAEYLDVLDDAAFGGATPVTPKRINLTDPASRWTAATREAAFYAYSTNYLIDLDHAVTDGPCWAIGRRWKRPSSFDRSGQLGSLST